MPDLRLEIEASPEDLIELHRHIDALHDPAIDVQARTKQALPGQLGEPILIALIVAAGGPTLTVTLYKAFDRWLTHKERMFKIRVKTSTGMRELKNKQELAELFEP